jgi:hypothetical protein
MVVCHLVLFLLTIVLPILLRFKDFDYTFGILKLFLSLLPTPTDQIALCCIAFFLQSMLLLSGSTCLLLATCLSVHFLKKAKFELVFHFLWSFDLIVSNA